MGLDLIKCRECGALNPGDNIACSSCRVSFPGHEGSNTLSETLLRVAGPLPAPLVLGLTGSVILLCGVFSPIIRVPMVGTLNFLRDGQGDGLAVLLLALGSLVLSLAQQFRGLWVTGGLSLLLVSLTLVRFQYALFQARANLDAELAGNPFRGLADVAFASVELRWGWLVLFFGSGLLLAAAYVGHSVAKGAERPLDLSLQQSFADFVAFVRSKLFERPDDGHVASGPSLGTRDQLAPKIEYLERKLRLYPDDLAGTLELAECYRTVGNLAKAAGLADLAVLLVGEDAKALQRVAELQAALGNYSSALDLYLRAAHADPSNTTVLHKLSSGNVLRHTFPGSIAKIEELAEQRSDADTLGELARICEEHGDLRRAASVREKALALRPDDLGIKRDLARLLESLDPTQAEVLHRDLLASNPKLPESNSWLIGRLLERQEFAAAAPLVDALLTTDPSNPEYQFRALRLAVARDGFAAHEHALLQALEKDWSSLRQPEAVAALWEDAGAYFLAHTYPLQAEAFLERSVKTVSSEKARRLLAQVQLLLGDEAARAGDDTSALKRYKRAFSLDPLNQAAQDKLTELRVSRVARRAEVAGRIGRILRRWTLVLAGTGAASLALYLFERHGTTLTEDRANAESEWRENWQSAQEAKRQRIAEQARREEARQAEERRLAEQEEDTKRLLAKLQLAEAEREAKRLEAERAQAEARAAELAAQREADARNAAEAERRRREAQAFLDRQAASVAAQREAEIERDAAERQEIERREAEKRRRAAEHAKQMASTWGRLKKGLTKSEVRQLLGNPKSIDTGSSSTLEFWLYSDLSIMGRGWVQFSAKGPGNGTLDQWREP